MDLLHRVLPAGVDLLDRAGTVLAAAGAPPDAPIWAPLRRLRILPVDAVDAVAGLDPGSIRAGAARLRSLRGEHATTATQLTGLAQTEHWGGAGAESFAATTLAQSDHLGDGLAGRLEETAAFFDDVADWIVGARRGLAAALAEAVGSVEAVALRADAQPVPDPATVQAAVAVSALVLEAVAAAYDRAEDLHRWWAGRLDELIFQPPIVGAARLDGVTWTHL
jgi:hypothetical protein